MSTTTENIKYVFDVVGDSAVKDLDAIQKGLDSLGSGFTKLGRISKSFSKSFDTSTSALKAFNKVASVFSGAAIGKALADGTKEAIDFYETLNLFQVAMKDSIDTGNEFIDTVSEWYGLDPKNLMDYTGLFYEMAYAVEAPTEAARILSTSLTALSVDLASLFNVDVERVADNLTSGIRGMSRAVVKYGLDIRAATVEAYANSLGIEAQYESMNEASREILRYLVMIRQADDALGDFSRTLDQPANQLRVFKEQVTQLGRAIGTFLVAPLKETLPVINGTVMAVRTMVEALSAFLGLAPELESPFEGGEESADGLESIGDSAASARKKLKAFLAPFDELNVMQDKSSDSEGLGFGDVDPRILEALKESEYMLSEIRMKAMDTRDAILEFFGFQPTETGWTMALDDFEKHLLEAFPKWQTTIGALFDFDYEQFRANAATIFEDFKRIGSSAVQLVLEDIARLFGFQVTDNTIATWIGDINGKLELLHTWLTDNEDTISKYVAKGLEVLGVLTALSLVLGPIGDVLISVGAGIFLISNAFGAVKTVLSVFSPLLSLVGSFFATIGTNAAALSAYFTGLSSSLGAATTSLATAGATSSSFIGILQTLLGVGSKFAVVFAGVSAVMQALFIGGFIHWAATSDEFREHLRDWGESLKSIFISVRDILVTAFNVIKNAILNVSHNFRGVFDAISGMVGGLLEVLDGLLKFVAGVFTGDWKRAWQGVCDVFTGIANTLHAAFVGVLNLIIVAVNKFVEFTIGGIINALNAAISGLSDILAFVGVDLNFQIPSIPEIPPIPVDKKFATGGVVTGPTRALIGEAGRAEAVIPLDNSPQMNELVNKIASAVSGNNRPMEVHVYLDNQEVAYGLYDELENVRATRGGAFVR